MRPEEYTTCSNCNISGPVRSMQDELPLTKPLCRKCRNAIPATVEDLINRYDAYITNIETSHKNYRVMAEGMHSCLVDFTELHENRGICVQVGKMKDLLDIEEKHVKSLHRP